MASRSSSSLVQSLMRAFISQNTPLQDDAADYRRRLSHKAYCRIGIVITIVNNLRLKWQQN